MPYNHLTRSFQFLILAIFLMTACSGNSSTGATIWIDAPLLGAQIAPGEIIQIQTHAYSAGGVAEIELAVNGNPFRRDIPSPSSGDLVTLSQAWSSDTPGIYTLQVSAISTGGAVSSPAAVSVEVLGKEETIAISPESTPIPEVPQAMVPTDTPAHLPQSPEIDFNADRLSLSSGECTYLSWDVKHATTAILDCSAVGMLDARQVCPSQTTTYTLRASSAGGDISRTVQIAVSVPPPVDTAGPIISSIVANPNLIYDASACGPTQVEISVAATDSDSGIKQVVIYYQVVKDIQSGKGVTTGTLISLKMNGTETQGFNINLGPAQLSSSLSLYGGGKVRYYVIATDMAGNTSQSKTFSTQIEICLI